MTLSRSLPLALMMLFLAITTTGCKHAVTFERHAPYQAAESYSAPLIIVIPDGLEEENYSIRLGLFPEPKAFRVFYGQALKEETAARFARMYDRIIVIDDMMYEEAMDPVRRLDDLDGLALDFGLGEQEWNSSAIEHEMDADLLKILQDRDGYLLRYRDVEFLMEERRPILSTYVVFTDRFTGQVLYQGRMTGAGTPVREYRSIDNLKKELKRTTVAACTSLLIRLSRNMVAGIEEPDPQG